MIKNSKEKTAWAYRTLREVPLLEDANVDVILFANYYGTVRDSHRFNDPTLITDKPWYSRLIYEIREMKIFRRNKKHEHN